MTEQESKIKLAIMGLTNVSQSATPSEQEAIETVIKLLNEGARNQLEKLYTAIKEQGWCRRRVYKVVLNSIEFTRC